MSDTEDLVCYTIGLNFVTSSNQYFPCGSNNGGSGVQSCCYAGDYCMEDSICHYTHSVTNGTGFYMAGCTDPTWQDPACPKQCTSEYGADIIYDTTNDQWNCCVSLEGYLNCQQPSDFTVQAPAPQRISTLTQLDTPAPSPSLTGVGSISSFLGTISTMSGEPDSSSASPTSSTSAPSSSSRAAASSSSTANAAASATASTTATSSPSSSGLSSGAIAGIVIGVIAGLTILIIGAWMLYRWNKRNDAAIKQHQWNQPPSEMGDSSGAMAGGEVYAHVGDKPAVYGVQRDGVGGYGAQQGQYHELSGPERVEEKDGQVQMPPQELMASPGREPAELGDGRKSALS